MFLDQIQCLYITIFLASFILHTTDAKQSEDKLDALLEEIKVLRNRIAVLENEYVSYILKENRQPFSNAFSILKQKSVPKSEAPFYSE